MTARKQGILTKMINLAINIKEYTCKECTCITGCECKSPCCRPVKYKSVTNLSCTSCKSSTCILKCFPIYLEYDK